MTSETSRATYVCAFAAITKFVVSRFLLMLACKGLTVAMPFLSIKEMLSVAWSPKSLTLISAQDSPRSFAQEVVIWQAKESERQQQIDIAKLRKGEI